MQVSLSSPSGWRTLILAVCAAGLVAACNREDASGAKAASEAAVSAERTGPDQDLLDKLAAATSEAEAARLEEEIWDAWLYSGSPTVDHLMTRALGAIEVNDLDRARDMFDRAIAIRPEYAEAWARRALLFFNDGKYDEAVADLEAALRAEPRHFGAWIGLGMIFESIERPQAALLAYRKALEIHPFAEAAKQGEKRLEIAVEGRSL